MRTALATIAAAVAAGAGSGAQQPETPAFEPVRCPAQEPGCVSASGRIVALEAIDPDGDGDAHFVLLSPDSVTAPGVTVVDVRRGLRPRPLPKVGEALSAAGPVFPGSYGQLQIQAVRIRVGG